ncbi:MAG TPA: type II secretion system F family protein [Pyrinomonadaceae bacterium]|jgi:tight adherence protein B|nr:type II secretion system F family protein [Pyrinomonadaceae bacterium]
MIPLLASLIVFVSVFLFVRAGFPIIRDLFERRAAKDIARFEAWSQELFLDWSPQKVRYAAYAANLGIVFVALFVLVLTGRVVFALAAAAVVFFVPTFLYRRYRHKRLERLESQLPDALNIMVSSARSGRSLPQAVAAVGEKMSGPAEEEFRLMAREYREGGMNLEGVLERAKHRVNVESFRMICSALIINSHRGGDVLHILERMSDSIRELQKLKKKLKTETAEVRAQEKIILVITPAFGLLICLFDADIPRLLFGTVPGNILLIIVLALQTLAVWWVRRIVKATI